MPGRVMIFDDDTDLLEVCSIVLKSKNYIVVALNKCSDIVQEVKTFSPNVILMDNWIPDVGGVKATQLLKNNPELIANLAFGFKLQSYRFNKYFHAKKEGKDF